MISRHLSISRKAAIAAAALVLGGIPAAVCAHAPGPATAVPTLSPWSFAEIFTFLFVTLGPLNVIGPFMTMTKGESASTKRRLALDAFVISLIGLLVVTAIGAATLQAWGISIGALLVTGGAILTLVALRPVLAGYIPAAEASQPEPGGATRNATELAFSPLAFPIIITPYGLALLVLLFTLHPITSGGLWILAAAAAVLGLDLAVMLGADRIARIPRVDAALNILGCVMNVLLIALGVQALADGLQLIGQHSI